MPQLEISLLANLTRYTADMARAQQTAEKTFAGINKASGLVGSALGAIATGFTLDAVKQQFDETVAHMAKLDDAAEITGVSVEKLSGIFYALKPSGATVEQITDLMSKLTRSMQGADEETKGAGLAFEKLGIKTRDANGNLRDSGDVLLEVSRTLATYAEGSNKSAIAQAILTKSGAQYLPLLKDLAESGDLVTKVTAEQAAAAETYEKELKKLSRASDDLKISVANELIPYLTNLIQQFNAGKEAAGGFLNAMLRFGLKDGPDKAADPLKTIGERASKIADIQGQIDKAKAIIEAPAGGVSGSARNAAKGRIKDLQDESTQLQKDIGYYQILAKQKGQLDNLLDPPPIAAKAKPQAPAIPKVKTGGASAGKTDFEKEREKALERIATLGADYANLESGAVDKLTESEKALVKIEADRASGKLKLNASEMATIRAYSQQAIVIDKAKLALQEKLKRDEDAKRAAESEAAQQKSLADSMGESLKARRQSIEEIGLEIGELTKLKAARIEAEISNKKAEIVGAQNQGADTSGLERQLELLKQNKAVGSLESAKNIETENIAQEKNIGLLGLSEAAIVRYKNAQLDQQIAVLAAAAAMEKASKGVSEYTENLDRLIAGLNKKKQLNEIEIDMKRIGEISSEIGGTLGRALEDGFVTGKFALKQFEQELLRLVTRELFTKPFSDMVTNYVKGSLSGGGGGGGLGSLFGNLFGGGGGGGFEDILNSPVLDVFSADGGPIAKSQPKIVGERGPEMFVPESMGSIVPSGALSEMMAGKGGNTININVSGVKDDGGLQRTSSQIAAAAGYAINRGARSR